MWGVRTPHRRVIYMGRPVKIGACRGGGETAGVSMARQKITPAQRMGGPHSRQSMAEQINNGVERRSERRSSSVAQRRGRTRHPHRHHSSGAVSGLGCPVVTGDLAIAVLQTLVTD